MATIVITIRSATTPITSTCAFANEDVVRVMEWAMKSNYGQSLGTPLPATNQEAWDRVTMEVVKGIMKQTEAWEREETDVPPIVPPTLVPTK